MSVKPQSQQTDATGSRDIPVELPWQKDANGYYPRLLRLTTQKLGLEGVGGIYALWHRGVRPAWIYFGVSPDLAESLARARDADAVLNWETSGGVYVSWVAIKPEFRDGVVSYLRATLSPKIEQDLDADKSNAGARPIAVKPPG